MTTTKHTSPTGGDAPLRATQLHTTQAPPQATQPHTTQAPPHATLTPPHATQEPPRATQTGPNNAAPETQFRSQMAATALAVGAVGLGALNLLSPWADSVDQVATLRADGDLLAALSVLWFCSSALLVAGVAGVVGRVRGRGSGLALAGGIAAGAGSIAGSAIGTLEGAGPALAGALSDDGVLSTAMLSFDTSPVLWVVFPVWLLGSVVGWPLLIGGAARAGLLSAWYAVPVAIAWAGNLMPTAPVVTAALVTAFVVPVLVLAWQLARAPQPTRERTAAERG